MKRVLRWIIMLGLAMVVALSAAAILVRARLHAKPAWYVRRVHNEVARRAAARSADNKLIDILTAAHRAQAAEIRARRAAAVDPPATAPAEPITLELTEDEMNAFLVKWEGTFGWKTKFGDYLDEPAVILEGDELILAANVKEGWNAVLSLHCQPRLQEGKLVLGPLAVWAGTLPAPRACLSDYETRLEATTRKNLAASGEKAEIVPPGWANAAMAEAAMSELLLHALHDEPAEPALFFPDPAAHEGRSLPMRILGIDIADKTLTLKVQLMDAGEREALLQHIRGNASGATAGRGTLEIRAR